VSQRRFIGEQGAQVAMWQRLALFLEALPDLPPAFVVEVESRRQDADRFAPVIGNNPWFFQYSGHADSQSSPDPDMMMVNPL